MRNQKIKKIVAGVVMFSMALSCLFIQPATDTPQASAQNADGTDAAESVGVTTGGGIGTTTGGGISTDTPVEEVKLNKKSGYLIPGKSIQLKASVKPAAAKQDVIWKASSTKYITLSQNGKVKAKKSKSAIGKKVTVTAVSAVDNTKQASCKLTIVRKVTSIRISGKSIVKAGKSFKLKAKVKPSNATVKSVKWTSSKKYATVSANGKVKTKKSAAKKSVIITATAKDGSGVKKKYYIWIY